MSDASQDARPVRPRRADAFGRALMDWARGGTEPEILEREDGVTDVGAGHELYLAEFSKWPVAERQSLSYARGRVVDVGCGAGRVALHLQGLGHEVVAVDASRFAVQAARRRGVRRTRCVAADALTPDIGSFDTVVLFGNNFGIFGTPDRLRAALTRWAAGVGSGARILAESTDPYHGGAPTLDRGYWRRNVREGRMAGQIRLRTRYRAWATPWFDWLFVSRRDMAALVGGTGWHVSRVVGGARGDAYVALLEKD